MGTLIDMSGDDLWVNSIVVDNTNNQPINYFGSFSSPVLISGIGNPSTSTGYPKGSLYISTTATTATTRLYICTSTASGSSLWAAITSAS